MKATTKKLTEKKWAVRNGHCFLATASSLSGAIESYLEDYTRTYQALLNNDIPPDIARAAVWVKEKRDNKELRVVRIETREL